MIVLQFARGTDLGSDLITWFSHGGWSHVDAVLVDGLLGARLPDGVRVREASYLGDSPVLRVQLECSPDVSGAFEAFLRAQVGKPYDVAGIAGFVSGRDWRSADAWFCSELIAAALEHAGYFEHPLATPTNKIDPADLLLALSVKAEVAQPAPTKVAALAS